MTVYMYPLSANHGQASSCIKDKDILSLTVCQSSAMRAGCVMAGLLAALLVAPALALHDRYLTVPAFTGYQV